MAEAASELKRVIICHNLAHMRLAFSAAAELGKPLVIQTAEGALRYAGAEYLLATFEKAKAEAPQVAATLVLDCDTATADALHAMRQGIKHLRMNAPEPARSKLLDIAAQLGTVVLEGEFEGLNLLYEYKADEACKRWLSAGVHQGA